MSATDTLSASVLICTYNRAALLAATLDSLVATCTRRPWEVVVIDNNSGDETRSVVEARRETFPVPLRYAFEGRQGKSNALNTGLAMCSRDVVVFTDDDVRVPAEWLDATVAPLEQDASLAYTGGPVRPLWETPPPAWFDQSRTDLWGPLALVDYGPEAFVFEERQRVPLGANMSVRKSLIDRVGGFNPELGRRGHLLLGQEQAEFFSRAREAGARGAYAPGAALLHFVPASRLTKDYFRRWWYWKGVSRARMDAIHHVTELGLDLTVVPHWFGVPRFMVGALPRSAAAWAAARVRGDIRGAMRHAMYFVYAFGYARAAYALWRQAQKTKGGHHDHTPLVTATRTSDDATVAYIGRSTPPPL